jgi:hypothetical protein
MAETSIREDTTEFFAPEDPRPEERGYGATTTALGPIAPPEVFRPVEELVAAVGPATDANGTGFVASPPKGDGGARSTARAGVPVCRWCLQPLGPVNRCGRTRVYCSQSCRQRAYQARKRAAELGLRDGELVVSTLVLSRMNKRLQALDLALLEVESARLHSSDQRIAELCRAAHRLQKLTVGPRVH